MRPTKRIFDVVCSGLGLIAFGPLLLLTALLVKLSDWGPVFYRQERIGRGGKPFRIWKFRTMVVDADKQGALITVGRDPRITRVGHILRKLKLDELPQIINVFVGQMSFVGPRPEVAKYVDLYTEGQARVLEAAPGITDPASLKYYDEDEVLAASDDPERTYREEVMPDKIRINMEYLATATVWSDFLLIWKTIFRCVT